LSDNIEIAKALPEISIEGADRLARAMAGTMVEPDGPDFAESLATRDTLLALA